jgi:hypothetical protein
MTYHLRPPILSVAIEDAMDIMILRNTARQAGSLIGFNPARRAQLSSAAAALGELVLKTGDVHTIHLNGVIDGIRLGLQISARTPWLADVPATNVLVALRSKVGDLVDEITISDDDEPIVRMFVWLNDLRADS